MRTKTQEIAKQQHYFGKATGNTSHKGCHETETFVGEQLLSDKDTLHNLILCCWETTTTSHTGILKPDKVRLVPGPSEDRALL